MPQKKSYRRQKRGLSGAFIAMGIISLIYSGVFPLFRFFDYAVLAVIIGVVGKVWRTASQKAHQKEDDAYEQAELERQLEQKKKEDAARSAREEAARREAERAKATTGDPAVDSLILKGQQMLQQVRSENERLPDPEITAQIDAIESIANQIFKAVIEQPQKANQIKRFMDYYLPTTLKMLVAYRRMEEGHVQGETADNAKARIRDSLDLVIQAFTKQLAKLYEHDALDITTDIDVMETMLKQDGLIDSGLHVRTSTGEEKKANG